MLSDIPFFTRHEFTKLAIIGNGDGGKIYKGNLDDFGYDAFVTRTLSFPHRHPNIVQLYGILWDGQDVTRYLGYVMEYVGGGSLYDVIHNPAKQYGTPKICSWIVQVSRGLQYIHRHQIIHRDINPKKMLLAGDRLQLADFGVAREIRTSVTAGVGTLRYMAPEVIVTGKYGFSVDVYSLAISIWEIFHRKRPYEDLGKDHFRRMEEIVNGLRPTIDTNLVDEDMGAFLKRAWSKDPIDRPRTEEIIDFFLLKSDNRPSEEAQNLDSDIAPSSSRSGQEMLSLSARLGTFSLPSEYKILSTLGIGGQAVVHKCLHDRLGYVAVKQFDKLDCSTREIRMLTKCPKHDHVVEILEVIPDESNHVNCLAYIMEYAPGGSFNQDISVIYGGTYYDALQCYRWLMQIASGLQHLHKNNIMHRDIKPQNILVINENYLKLSDFGMARFINGITLTPDLGTPRYMAPEVIESNIYDFSADIYSLSITIWETLYRRKPFSELGEISEFKLKTEVVNGTRPAMDANPKVQLDDGMTAFIKSCWHPTAAKRPIADNVVTFITGRVCHSTPPTNKCKVQ